MATYKVHYKASTNAVRVLKSAAATPAGYTALGTFDHGDDADDELGNDLTVGTENHVFYHHVRDLLFTEAGVQDMQRIAIEVPKLASISAVIGDDTLANLATSQITVTPTPANAINTDVTYSSDDEDVATVSNTGLVTAGAVDGEAVITITAVDRDVDNLPITDTITVTVA